MNTIKYIRFLFIMGLFAVVGCNPDEEDVSPSPSALADTYDSQLLIDWIQTYLEVETNLVKFRPSATSRALGYIHMATYLAGQPGISNSKSLNDVLPNAILPQFDNETEAYQWQIAVNEAYRLTLNHFMIGLSEDQRNIIDRRYRSWDDLLRANTTEEVYNRSREWGMRAAQGIIDYAETDIEGSTQVLDGVPEDYTPPVGLGLWVATDGKALFPYWGKARTFATFDFDQYLIDPLQPSLDPQSEFYKQAVEVDETIANLTTKDRWIAEFWSDDIVGLTFSPPARLFAIAEQLVEAEQMPMGESLLFLVKLGMSINDASVICWYAKYKYNIIRPENFIRDYINPNFKTILGEAIGRADISPAFPAYPSGHSTFASAGSGIFIAQFGEQYGFTDRCHEGRTEFMGFPRSFVNFKDLAAENAYSRIPLGVHFRMDCDEGLRLGYIVADNIEKLFK